MAEERNGGRPAQSRQNGESVIELEKALLAGALQDRRAISAAREEGIEPEHFTNPAYTDLWSVLVRLDAEMAPEEEVDAAVVGDIYTSDATKAKLLAGLGGVQGIYDLAASEHSPLAARQVAKRLVAHGGRRSLTQFLKTTLQELESDGEQDPADLRSKIQAGLDKTSVRQRSTGLMIDKAAFLTFRTIREADPNVRPIPTGLYEFDEILDGGFRPKQLVLFGARPGQGKTSLGLYIASSAARNGISTLFANYEMDEIEMTMRWLAAASGVSMRNLRRNQLSEADLAALNAAIEGSQIPLRLLAPDDSRIDTLEAIVREDKQRRDVRLVVVDYVGLLSSSGAESRYAEVSDISRRLKRLAQQNDITVLAMAQLSRKSDDRTDKRPQLSDLRDCLTGDTRILDAATGRLVRMDDAYSSGEQLCVFALGEDLKLHRSRASRVWQAGEKQVFKIRTRSGRSIRASANHRFLTINGWRTVADLAVGSEIAAPRRLTTVAERLDADDLRALAASDLLWDEVVEITPDGVEMTYDVEVPDGHSFVANDLLTHNSGQLEQDADVVVLLHRPAAYDDQANENEMDLHVAKQRNGPTERIVVHWIPERATVRSPNEPDIATAEVEGVPWGDGADEMPLDAAFAADSPF